jgi:hypothetical protein
MLINVVSKGLGIFMSATLVASVASGLVATAFAGSRGAQIIIEQSGMDLPDTGLARVVRKDGLSPDFSFSEANGPMRNRLMPNPSTYG